MRGESQYANIALGSDLVAQAAISPQIAASPKEQLNIERTRNRLAWGCAMFCLVFIIFALRLGDLTLLGEFIIESKSTPALSSQSRGEITDRGGILLATELATNILAADASQIHISETEPLIEKLSAIIPSLYKERARKLLNSKRRFVVLHHQITPEQHLQIRNLGIPGILFQERMRRVYPNENIAAHILGYVSRDQKGRSGLELSIDKKRVFAQQGEIRSSIDIRLQYQLHRHIAEALVKYKARAAVGIVMDLNNGEVLSMVSLPGFNPNEPGTIPENAWVNRANAAVYELGSLFKIFTIAMALESGEIDSGARFDASEPLAISGFEIDDFYGQKRPLTMEEVLIYSSNIGAAKIALQMGSERQEAFLKRLGLLVPLETELPELVFPIIPKTWDELSTVTISYGHGISVSPLQFLAGANAMVNGGVFYPPSLLLRSGEEAEDIRERVFSEQASLTLRKMMRLVITKGSGRNARTGGYDIIGKTGTAEKPIAGGYDSERLVTSFFGAFPAKLPQYSILILLDEPQAIGGAKLATAAYNAAPLAGNIIKHIAPLLGIVPSVQAGGVLSGGI